MNKEDFLKKLNKNLKYLKKQDKIIELEKYNNIDTTNLDPTDEANKIYKERNIKAYITPETTLYNAIKNVIEIIKSKNKDSILKTIAFFIINIFIAILLKIPFIYTRDMIINLFNQMFINNTTYIVFNILIEIFYAIVAIIYLINKIKRKFISTNI